MTTNQLDFLIVGQGLAGTILAHTLLTRGYKVLVIDNNHHGSSSKVAAGIINPITGPRLKKNNDFELYYSKAQSYYPKLEYHIKENVFNNIEQIKLIKTEEQFAYFQERCEDPSYQKFIKLAEPICDLFKAQPFPQVHISNSAVIHTNALLSASQKWLNSIDSYLADNIDYQQLEFSTDTVRYKDHQAKEIIFCEGYQATHNPWLKHLPFKLAKGEILTVDATEYKLNDTMLNWDKWLVPFGNSAKLGSNFEWENLTLTTSNKIKTALLNSIHEHTHLQAKIISHEVGIRPSSKYRIPFIGSLPKQNNAYCFNGFGSKGCLLIPYYAELLVDHLTMQSPLPQELTKWL